MPHSFNHPQLTLLAREEQRVRLLIATVEDELIAATDATNASLLAINATLTSINDDIDAVAVQIASAEADIILIKDFLGI